ncbi:hypothetical protein HYW21_02135 [Candidatus Woesearchaeota archaeon]|nr:hypothetical protein [Candidatus Woesearchaeota archaeon]
MVREITDGVVRLGVVKSMKAGDSRVAVSPPNVPLLKNAPWDNGRDRVDLEVMVEKDAGEKSGYADKDYEAVGARIVDLDEVMETGHILLDVKQRPVEGVLPDGVNFFYAHVEKGQGPEQLRALLGRGGVTAYSPETIWVLDGRTGEQRRGVNLGYYAGVGGVHLLLEGVNLSHRAQGYANSHPFHFFPEVHGANYDQISHAYGKIGDQERGLRFAIIGGSNGLVSSGASREFRIAGLSFDLLYKDITRDEVKMVDVAPQYDGIINASVWNPGDPRIVTRNVLAAMKEGAVFIDDTCDQDRSSTPDGEGDPVIGGVRYSFETKWGDPNAFYWVGPDGHTFEASSPREQSNGARVLYNTIGMIPGGTTTAKAASDAYFRMIFPYLVNIIRAVSQGTTLPENGMVVRDGRIFHPMLREQVGMRNDLAEFRPHL